MYSFKTKRNNIGKVRTERIDKNRYEDRKVLRETPKHTQRETITH